MKFIVLIGALLITSFSSASEVSLLPEQIAKNLASFPVVYADFTQTKTIPALKRPIVTRGKLIYSKQHGVIWSIEQPLQLRYILREDRIVEIDQTGNKKIRSAQDIPNLAQVNRVFSSLLRADLAILSEYFTPEINGNEKHWLLKLQPKQQLATIFKQVRVEGGKFIERLELDEGNGDQTKIVFHNSRGAETLRTEELNQLQGK